MGCFSYSYYRRIRYTNNFLCTEDEQGSIQVDGRIRVAEVGVSVTPVAGDMRYNTSTNKHQGYNGTSWNDFY
jgi:hypothetical protein